MQYEKRLFLNLKYIFIYYFGAENYLKLILSFFKMLKYLKSIKLSIFSLFFKTEKLIKK